MNKRRIATERPAARRGSTCVRGRAPVIPPTGRESGPWRTSGGALRSRPSSSLTSAPPGAKRGGSTAPRPAPAPRVPARGAPTPRGSTSNTRRLRAAGLRGLRPAREGVASLKLPPRHQSARVPSLAVPPGSSHATPPSFPARPRALSPSSRWADKAPRFSRPLLLGSELPNLLLRPFRLAGMPRSCAPALRCIRPRCAHASGLPVTPRHPSPRSRGDGGGALSI